MMITKEIAIAEVTKWINSSITPEQLDCCTLFVQDTIYMRFDANDSEVVGLRLLIDNKKTMLEGK